MQVINIKFVRPRILLRHHDINSIELVARSARRSTATRLNKPIAPALRLRPIYSLEGDREGNDKTKDGGLDTELLAKGRSHFRFSISVRSCR
jgi:hypothetical protein